MYVLMPKKWRRDVSEVELLKSNVGGNLPVALHFSFIFEIHDSVS